MIICGGSATDLPEQTPALAKIFNVVDLVTDNMSIISDKLVDSISGLIKKVFVNISVS